MFVMNYVMVDQVKMSEGMTNVLSMQTLVTSEKREIHQ